MKIKNQRSLVNAFLGLVLLVACIYVWINKGFQVKYLIASAISVGFIIINLIQTVRKKGLEELILGQADERDLYNAMKSSQGALKITNNICFILAILFFLIYGIVKADIYLTIGVTLVGVIILMFVSLLLCDYYYEKHN